MQNRKVFIYKILNIVNNKIYIGRTINFEKRIKDHLRSLRNNIHFNEYLQTDYNDFGESSFVYEIIYECDNETQTLSEIQHIHKYKSHIRLFGYNIFGPNSDALKFTCGTIVAEKISQAHLFRNKSIPITAYTTDLKFIAKFNSITKASKYFKCQSTIIYEIIIGKRLTYKGMTFFKQTEVPHERKSSKQRNMINFHKPTIDI
jgi:hypothetical protein